MVPAAPPLVPANDFVLAWHDTESDVLAAVREVGESGWYVLGKQVAAFEGALAAFCRIEHAVGCASGLDGIELGLRALDLRPGDRVLTTPLSAFATSLAIVRAGGVPCFVDVDDSGLMRLDQAEDALARDRSIRVVLPVHLYGHALDLERLDALRTKFGVEVLEDAAQAIGAAFHDRPVGTVGALTALSFYPTKNLGALGDGGAVLTSRAELAERCRSLRDYGQSARYVHDRLGLNSRLDELHAAILLRAFLPRLQRWTQRRTEIAERYLGHIQSPHVLPLPAPAGSRSVWHLFPVIVPPSHRDAFLGHLKAHGISGAIHYPTLISEQRALQGTAAECFFDPTRARLLAQSEVSLPIHPYLEDALLDRVIEVVNGWRPA